MSRAIACLRDSRPRGYEGRLGPATARMGDGLTTYLIIMQHAGHEITLQLKTGF